MGRLGGGRGVSGEMRTHQPRARLSGNLRSRAISHLRGKLHISPEGVVCQSDSSGLNKESARLKKESRARRRLSAEELVPGVDG